MMQIPAEPWIKQRLQQRGVFEEDGKWKGNMRGEDVGTFNTQVEALKAYRAAVEKKFGDQAMLPSVKEIEVACAHGAVAAEPHPSQPQPRPQPPPQSPPQPKHEPKPEPKQQAKPTPRPAPHRR